MARIQTTRYAKNDWDELRRDGSAEKRLRTCRARFPPTRQNRSREPFVLLAASLRSTAARDNDGCEFPTPFRWRIRRGRPPRAIRRQDQLDSWPASESMRNSKMISAAKI